MLVDGGRNPYFQEKFQIPLIEGLRELNITVWNSNTLSRDDFIGTGRIQLYKVIAEGYDDSSVSLQTRNLKYAGEVKLVLHFSGALSSKKKENPSAYISCALPPATTYGPPQPYAQPPPATMYPPVGGGYPYIAPPSAPPAYPSACYPPPPVMNQYRPAAYPPAPYPPYGPSYQPTPAAQSPYYQTPVLNLAASALFSPWCYPHWMRARTMAIETLFASLVAFLQT